MRINKQFIILVIISGLLTSCASSGVNTSNEQLSVTPEHYIQLAAESTGEQQTQYHLLAAEQYLNNKQYLEAQNVLNNIGEQALNATDFAQLQILLSQLSLINNQPQEALAQLQRIPAAEQLPTHLQIQHQQMLAETYQALNQPTQAINQRLALATLLTDSESAKINNQTIWQLSQSLPDNVVQQLAQDKSSEVLRGWASLTLIARNAKSDPTQLAHQLHQWRQDFPNHPADILLDSVLPNANATLTMPKQIAILLPTSGPYAEPAAAILHGILQAYYQLPAAQRPIIRFYNTNDSQGVRDIYHQALEDGANFVIGPLTKTDVEKVADDAGQVPTVALNYGPRDQSLPANFYEFGLSPENEAIQIANYLWQAGLTKVALISPFDDRGQSVATNFANRLQNLGGQVLVNSAISKSDLDYDVMKLLNIDKSNARADALKRLLPSKFKFLPRRRQDIQAIFLNASPEEARQIIPRLRFYFAGDIPVYATSFIYTGMPDARLDTDLNDVIFTDMPWVVNPSPEAQTLQTNFNHLWPQNYRNFNKLYALGMDSFNLIYELIRIKVFPQSGFHGYTGDLLLENSHYIYRQLQWASFVHGEPAPIYKKLKTIVPLK